MFQLDEFHQLTDLEVANQRVFVRADLDAAVEADGTVLDDTKIRALVPTLKWLLEHEALVVVGAHLGPLSSPPQRALGLADSGAQLAGYLDTELYMPDENLGPVAGKLLREQRAGQIVLLDNLAFDDGERQCSPDYARELIAAHELYVGDGLFGELDTASLSLAPKFCQQRAMGLNLSHELSQLERLLETPRGKAVWCVGGRFSERLPVLNRAIVRGANVVVGASLAPPLLVASGRDLTLDAEDEKHVPEARTWLSRARDAGLTVLLPTDLLCRSNGEHLERNVNELRPGEPLVDWGKNSLEAARALFGHAASVLILDPLGGAVAKERAHLRATTSLLETAATLPQGIVLLVSDLVLSREVLPALSDDQRDHLRGISTAKQGVLASLCGKRSPSLEALRVPL